jgi:Protein of unknown function (DUF3631)
MTWPPDELWPKIAALWSTYGTPSASANERDKAFATLKQYQNDFGLSDCQLAFIAEHQILDPSSRIFKRERPENAFEITLNAIDGVGLVMPFEHFVVDTAWALHTYVFRQFLHTPRLLIWSRGSGYGKTARLSCQRELANQARYMVAPTPAVLYHYLRKYPETTYLIDDAERSGFWDRQSVLVQVIDAGHRQGGETPRVRGDDVIWYPTFAPLALGIVLDRDRRNTFPPQILDRSIKFEMKKSPEGLDEIFPGDPRFVPVRAVAARWAETFQRPPTVSLPKGIVARCAKNWHVLTAIADTLGYGATLRAAAVAIEAANFDPEVRLYEDIYLVFKQWQVDRLWTSELLQALRGIEGGPWAALTSKDLYDQLYRKGIDYRTVWKTNTHGARRSNNGFYRKQFEPVWHELGIEHTDTQSNKIIQIAAHKRHTEDTHD